MGLASIQELSDQANKPTSQANQAKMRYHKGFWVYAGEEGASISESAGRFAREQATLPVPGDSKAAGNWLRSRAGRTLRDRWLACTPDTRQMYMNNNPDESFPLADNPEGIADARRERSRYPRMVPADVTTPRVLQEAVATTPRPNASPTDRTTRKQLDAVQKYCGKLIRAALDAEVTAMGYAIKKGDIDLVVTRSAAVVECMGANIANGISPPARSRVVEIATDVAHTMRAAATQMTMYTDREAQDALQETVSSVRSAELTLCNYVRDIARKNRSFETMYNHREKYDAVSTKYLQHFFLLGAAPDVAGASALSDTSTSQAAADGDDEDTRPEGRASSLSPTDQSAAETENPTHSDTTVVNPRKRRRQSAPLTHPTETLDRDNVEEEAQICDVSDADESRARADGASGDECGASAASGMSGEESDDSAEIISSGGAKSSSDEESDNPSEYDNASNAEGDASHWFFRKRFNQNHLLFEWKEPESAADDRVVFMYQADLDSLLPDGLLTGTVLDYFIYRYMARVQGLVCACGSGMYLAMETARYTRKPTRKTRLLEELIAQRDWTSYKYLILPVSGRNHWSFLVLENVMNSEPTKVYHVNSLKNAHSPDYAFDVVHWFLSRLHEKKMFPPFQWSTFIHNTKPQQSNTLDCGVYALYYMDFISKKISVKKPDSVQQNMALWTTGGLNVTKAGVYRSQLYNRISLGP